MTSSLHDHLEHGQDVEGDPARAQSCVAGIAAVDLAAAQANQAVGGGPESRLTAAIGWPALALRATASCTVSTTTSMWWALA